MKSLILFSLFVFVARASSLLRYLLIGCKDNMEVEQFISSFITVGKYETREENGLFLVDIRHSSSSCGQPMQIISTHPIKGKEDSMSALLNFIGFGAIDGVLTALEDGDERVDLIRELHLTSVPHRQPTSLAIIFRQSGSHKYIHYGRQFTFLGDLRTKMIQANQIFQMSQKVRIMDTFWVYRRAHIETTHASRSKMALKIYDAYTVSLFNCLVGHQFSLKLLVAAIQQGDLKMIAYLIDELPEHHSKVLKALVQGLSDIELPEIEVGSPLHQLSSSYGPEYTCSRYTGYHESFERIVSIRIRAIQEEMRFNAKKAEINASIERLEGLEAITKADIEAAGEMNNKKAHWIGCLKLDEITVMINRSQEELGQLELKHQEVMLAYRAQVEEAYFL